MKRRPLLGACLFGLAAATRGEGGAVRVLKIGGSEIDLQFDEGFAAPVIDDALVWADRAGDAVAQYLGRLPLARFEIVLQAVDGAGVKGGTAFPRPRPHLRIRLGRETRRARFDDDWILVHEMLHLAVPQLAPPHRWLHEGIATYAEGAARVLAGIVPAARWWGELVRGLPQGLPQAGDRGLDHTPTWGRTYWGGALFCLLADVQIRRRSQQRLGLREALQGLLAAGGSYAVAWSAEQVLAAADAAVAQDTLTQLYTRMKDQPAPVDLDALWRDLGVEGGGGPLPRLSDEAPLAAARRAIAS